MCSIRDITNSLVRSLLLPGKKVFSCAYFSLFCQKKSLFHVNLSKIQNLYSVLNYWTTLFLFYLSPFDLWNFFICGLVKNKLFHSSHFFSCRARILLSDLLYICSVVSDQFFISSYDFLIQSILEWSAVCTPSMSQIFLENKVESPSSSRKIAIRFISKETIHWYISGVNLFFVIIWQTVKTS